MIEEINGDFFQWLRGFYFVAKNRSFSQAALDMGRSQSTISHQVKCLEKEFGVKLIDRSSNKLELTPEGNIFFNKAIAIFEQITGMKEFSNQAMLKITGQIRISTTQPIIRYFLSRHISEFIKKHNGVTFDIEGGNRNHILEKIRSGEVAFGILNRSSVPNKFAYYNLFETGFVLIASKNAQFKASDFRTLKQISRQPFIVSTRSSTMNPWVNRKFSRAGLKLNRLITLNNVENTKKYVGIGIGVAIIYNYMLSQEDKDLDVFPLDHLFKPIQFGLVMRKNRYASAAVKEFLKLIMPSYSADLDLNEIG